MLAAAAFAATRRTALYARLGRLHTPTGANLLFWPCCWTIILATPTGTAPDWRLIGLFWLGATMARAAGCAWNDLLDRNIDARAQRGRSRPIASGALTPLDGAIAAILFAGLAVWVGTAVLTPMAWVWVLAATPLVALYPLAKRITRAPQAVLGIVFNWGALVGWVVVAGAAPSLAAWTLYAACWAWTLAYDTAYAIQDARDDARDGVGSLAAALGERARGFALGSALASLIGIAAAAWLASLAWYTSLLLIPAGWVFLRALAGIRASAPQTGAQAFRRADLFGLLVALALLGGGAAAWLGG